MYHLDIVGLHIEITGIAFQWVNYCYGAINLIHHYICTVYRFRETRPPFSLFSYGAIKRRMDDLQIEIKDGHFKIDHSVLKVLRLSALQLIIQQRATGIQGSLLIKGNTKKSNQIEIEIERTLKEQAKNCRTVLHFCVVSAPTSPRCACISFRFFFGRRGARHTLWPPVNVRG